MRSINVGAGLLSLPARQRKYRPIREPAGHKRAFASGRYAVFQFQSRRSLTDPDKGPMWPTFLEAVKAIGWFPLTLMGIGGISVVDLLDKAILEHDLNLITPFQIALHGYRRIAALAAAAIEPILQPVLARLSELLHVKIVLQPYWRPLFFVGLIYASMLAKVGTAISDTPPIWNLVPATCVGLFALLCAIVVGVVPLTASWWAQGVGIGIVCMGLMAGVFLGLKILSFRNPKDAPPDAGTVIWVLIAAGTIGFFLVGVATLLPGIKAPSVLGLLMFIALSGVGAIGMGIEFRRVELIRFGLISFGGFLAGGLVLAMDGVIKVLR